MQDNANENCSDGEQLACRLRRQGTRPVGDGAQDDAVTSHDQAGAPAALTA